jgi:hypothetical protein
VHTEEYCSLQKVLSPKPPGDHCHHDQKYKLARVILEKIDMVIVDSSDCMYFPGGRGWSGMKGSNVLKTRTLEP